MADKMYIIQNFDIRPLIVTLTFAIESLTMYLNTKASGFTYLAIHIKYKEALRVIRKVKYN